MGLVFLLMLIFGYILSFLITSGIIWGICWAFALTFSWKMAFGIWLIILLLNAIFDSKNNNK